MEKKIKKNIKISKGEKQKFDKMMEELQPYIKKRKVVKPSGGSEWKSTEEYLLTSRDAT